MFAVCVTFQIQSDKAETFMPLMLENARVSLIDEPDCHQFDVLTNTDTPDTVFLYEIYTDRAAFDVHLGSEHFLAFDKASAPMIADKKVLTWDTVTQ